MEGDFDSAIAQPRASVDGVGERQPVGGVHDGLALDRRAVDRAGEAIVDTRQVGPRIVGPIVGRPEPGAAGSDITVGQRPQRLPAALGAAARSRAGVVGELHVPGASAARIEAELSEVGHHHVRTRVPESPGRAQAVHAHNQSEPAVPARFDTGKRIFDHHRPVGIDTEPGGRFQVGGWVRLAGKAHRRGDATVDRAVEQAAHACCSEYLEAVAAGRNHR